MTHYTSMYRDIQWMHQVTSTMTHCLPYTAEQQPVITAGQHFLQRLFEYNTKDEQVAADERYPDDETRHERVVYFGEIIGDTLNATHMKTLEHILSDVPIYEIALACDDDVSAVLYTYEAVESDAYDASPEQRLVTQLLLHSLYQSDQLGATLIQMMQNLSQIPTAFSPHLCDIVYRGYGPENDFQWGVRSAFDVHVVRSALIALDRFDYRRDTPIAWQRELFHAELCTALTDRVSFEQSMAPALHYVRQDRV